MNRHMSNMMGYATLLARGSRKWLSLMKCVAKKYMGQQGVFRYRRDLYDLDGCTQFHCASRRTQLLYPTRLMGTLKCLLMMKADRMFLATLKLTLTRDFTVIWRRLEPTFPSTFSLLCRKS